VSPLGAVRMLRPGRAGRRAGGTGTGTFRVSQKGEHRAAGCLEPVSQSHLAASALALRASGSGRLPPPPPLCFSNHPQSLRMIGKPARHGTAWRGVLTAAAACGRGDRLTRGVRSAAGDLARSQCHHHGRRRWGQRAGRDGWKWNGSTRSQGSKRNGGGLAVHWRERESCRSRPDSMGPDPVKCSRPPWTRARLLAAVREHKGF